MSKSYSMFSYKKGSSFLHKCPAWVKILFVPVINILFLFLPVYWALGLIAVQFTIACCLRFTIREQLCDLKPVFYFIILFIFADLLSLIGSGKSFFDVFNWENQKGSLESFVTIFAVLQSASLMFKTSTSLEMRDGIAKLFGQKSAFTNALFMFLNFIPMVSRIWEQSKRAWIARGGKQNVKMYITLLPVLFSVGMKKAYNAARAVSIRN